MPVELSPQQLQQMCQDGFGRLENFRAARIMFLRQFVGQYYDADHGPIGTEPLNLIFNAIRVLVPNLVYNFPKHRVSSRFLAHRPYGDMLGMALSQQDKQMNMRDVYRRWIVDAIFMMGILKTGITDSGTAIGFNEDDQIDPGTVYTDNVDFDNFVIDPTARKLEDATFLGDRIRVARLALLESGLYNNAMIERLPSVGSSANHGVDRAEQLSQDRATYGKSQDYGDDVEIVELWVPRAKSIVTVPGDMEYSAEDFLRVHDYYGPNTGPYTFLTLTPPVPNNPIPISMVGIWHDLHIMANKMAKKIMEQADRQKDIIGYKRTSADDAQEALQAHDGEAIAMDAPEDVKTFSFGGQQTSNEVHVNQLQQWFNMMAGNPEGMAGMSMNAKSATEANMLQSNAQISLEDMKDMVYSGCAREGRNRAWYLHTDPLLEVPLIRRVTAPSQIQQTAMGPVMVPAQQQEVQVMLTPEARSGDFLDYTFDIVPESMGRVDSAKRLLKAMEFATKVLPAASAAAQVCMQMGIPFSFPKFVIKMANELEIEWMDEVFYDPEFQAYMQMLQMRGPQSETSKGAAPPGGGMAGIMQNGQPPGVMGSQPTAMQEGRMQAQSGAAEGQAQLPNRETY